MSGYIPLDYDKAPFLGELPLRKNSAPVEYDVSSYVTPGTTQILIYAFITVKSADRVKKRAVYQIYTEDDSNVKYSQLMNTAFPENDFVMNSANLWLPVFGKKKFTIRIPDSWSTLDVSSEGRKDKQYKNLDEAMRDYVTGDDSIYTGVFLLGYRH